MSTHNPRRFATPEHLKRLDSKILIQFLLPFESYLETKGIHLKSYDNQPIKYEFLSSVLLNANEDMPVELSDALYFVNEMSSDDKIDILLDAARDNKIEIIGGPDITPMDIAARLWIVNSDILESLHAETLVSKPKSFEHFRSADKPPKTLPVPDSETILKMQNDFDEWFIANKRGGSCKVFPFDHGRKLCLLVRHGKPFKREGSLTNGESQTILYRPESYDVIIYDHHDNELAINGSVTKGEKTLYLEVIGRHLFGKDDYFLNETKYSLEPLLKDGAMSLVCTDVSGIDGIKLIQIKRYLGGAHGDKETIDSKDYFSSKSWDGEISSAKPLVSATFAIHFENTKRARTVRIVPPNKAIYERDDDSVLVENLLKARGFIMLPKIHGEVKHEVGIKEAMGCN